VEVLEKFLVAVRFVKYYKRSTDESAFYKIPVNFNENSDDIVGY
jgi:hypothetical protein